MTDRQEPTISQTGVWVDLETGRVVESQPEAGKLIVSPGGEIDQRVLDDIAAAKLAVGQTDDEPAPVDEADDTESSDGEPAQSRRGRPPGSKSKATVADTTEKATE